MTPKRKRFFIVGIPLTASALVIGGLVYYMAFLPEFDLSEAWEKAIVERFGKPHVLPEPDLQRWALLKVNMTQAEVKQLLGEPPSNRRRAATKPSFSDEELRHWERWNWGFDEGLASREVHEKSWLIYFDREGKVTSFRRPLVGQESSR